MSQKLIYNLCKMCGIPQGRKLNSMCWEKYNVCSKCWKANYRITEVKKKKKRETQSCKVCGLVRTNIYNKAKCWESDLCGICITPVTKIIKYKKKKVCQCGEVMVRLNYIKRGVHVGTNFRVCTKCSYISRDRNSRYNIATLM